MRRGFTKFRRAPDSRAARHAVTARPGGHQFCNLSAGYGMDAVEQTVWTGALCERDSLEQVRSCARRARLANRCRRFAASVGGLAEAPRHRFRSWCEWRLSGRAISVASCRFWPP